MSYLSDIFNPVARAYYKRKYANSSQAPAEETGVVGFALHKDMEYEDSFDGGEDGVFYKVSRATPPLSDFKNAKLFVLSPPNSTGTVESMYFDLSTEGEEGLATTITIGSSAPIGIVVYENGEAELGLGKGVWMRSIPEFPDMYIVFEP